MVFHQPKMSIISRRTGFTARRGVLRGIWGRRKPHRTTPAGKRQREQQQEREAESHVVSTILHKDSDLFYN